MHFGIVFKDKSGGGEESKRRDKATKLPKLKHCFVPTVSAFEPNSITQIVGNRFNNFVKDGSFRI